MSQVNALYCVNQRLCPCQRRISGKLARSVLYCCQHKCNTCTWSCFSLALPFVDFCFTFQLCTMPWCTISESCMLMLASSVDNPNYTFTKNSRGRVNSDAGQQPSYNTSLQLNWPRQHSGGSVISRCWLKHF